MLSALPLRFHNNFIMLALFYSARDIKFSPPLFFGEGTSCQATWDFFMVYVSGHKKDLQIELIFYNLLWERKTSHRVIGDGKKNTPYQLHPTSVLRSFELQCLILIVIPSTKLIQWWIDNFFLFKGNPKYLKISRPSSNSVIFYISALTFSSTLPKYTLYLEGLMFMLVEFEKSFNTFIEILTYLLSPLEKICKSSAKLRLTICNFLHFKWKFKFGTSFNFYKVLLRYSMTITNNNRDSGSYCLKPLFAFRISV